MASRPPAPGTRPQAPAGLGPTSLGHGPARQSRPPRRRRAREAWIEELHGLGFQEPRQGVTVDVTPVGRLDRDALVETVLTRLGSKRSAWNAADIRGEIEQQIAAAGVVTDPVVRRELAEDLTARAIEACIPLLARTDVPEHVRSLTSPQVLAVEDHLTTTLTTRAQQPLTTGYATQSPAFDDAQKAVLAAMTGRSGLLVVEGAAGAGKTNTLEGAVASSNTKGTAWSW